MNDVAKIDTEIRKISVGPTVMIKLSARKERLAVGHGEG
jgi:hypothetical protein